MNTGKFNAKLKPSLISYKKSARNYLQALDFVEHTGVGPVTS